MNDDTVDQISIINLPESVSINHHNLIFNSLEMGAIVKGRIVREKRCIGYNYYYECENINGSHTRLLKAVRSLCGFDIFYYFGNSLNYCGRIKSDILGSTYVLYKEINSQSIELAFVKYDVSFCSSNGPRSFITVIYGFNRNMNGPELKYKSSLKRAYKKKDYNSIVVLCNKKPFYNPETNSYVLNFNGRVTMPSVKNFQLIHPQDPAYISMTFGKVGTNEFILDFQYPWCALQGFCVGISALDYKIWCE
ncbi:Protein king tubby [Astathelohania contejeani]|uniref:Protein king tubby n=1 Tax=Astathelohania contejeani TaxID=164912 RepID=A0ABQ7I1X2_9MICR|nr:Protein king tubby [Thelohania contejeani]